MATALSRVFKKHIVCEIICLLLLSLTPLLWLKSGEVVMGHDSGFRINFIPYYKSLLFAWNPSMNFGIDWQLYKGFLTTQLPEFLFTVGTGSWETGQRMTMVFWFFAVQLSMYVLVRSIRWENKHWLFRIGTSVFYAYNFFILQAWFIVERAKFSLYAALPISIFLLYRVFILKKSIVKNAVLFGLLYFFFSGGGSPPLYGATLVTWMCTIALFTIILWKKENIRGLIFSVKTACIFGIVFVSMNAFWIIPQAGLYINTYTSAVAQRGGIDGLIAWERENSKNAGIINLLRLEGIPDWYENPYHAYAKNYLDNPILIVSSFIPIVAILFGLMHSWEKKVKHNPVIYLTFMLLSVGLFFAGGSHPPLGIVFEYAMRHVPGFAIFRSSFYKFGPLVWFSVILLSLYFIDTIIMSRIKIKTVRAVLGIAVILGILLYHYPYFKSDFFRFYGQFSTKVRVPAYTKEMAAYVHTNTDPLDRLLVLPKITSRVYNLPMDAYTWNFLSTDVFPRNVINRSIIANDTLSTDVIHTIYSELLYGTKENFLRLSRIAGIRYILWREDALYNPTITDVTKDFQKKRLAQLFSNPIHTSGLWELYDIEDPHIIPLVWTPDTISVTEQATDNPLDLLLTSQSQKMAVIEGTTLPQDFIQADCLYCQENEYMKMVLATPLPRLRFEPGNPLFSLLLMKDKEAIQNADPNPEAQFNAYISHTQFLLALLDSPEKPKMFDQESVISDLKKSFLTSLDLLSTLSGRQKNVYATRLLLFTDVSTGFISKMTGLPDTQKSDLEAFFHTLRSEAETSAWLTSDKADIRYEIQTQSDDSYDVLITNMDTPLPPIEIDGITVQDTYQIYIPSGYHRLRVMSPFIKSGTIPRIFFKKTGHNTIQIPEITFHKIDPTRYRIEVRGAKEPYVLVLNELFEKNWKVKIESSNAHLDETLHGKANGYANAWYIEKTGDHTMIIFYQPQAFFFIGCLWSITAIAGSMYVLIKK